MKKQMKNLAAAATLAVGLGTAANAAQVEEIRNDEPAADRFSKNLYIDFNMKACTSDNYTVTGPMRVFLSYPDMRRKQENNEKVNVSDIKSRLDEAWRNAIENHPSSYYQKDTPDAQQQIAIDSYKSNMREAIKDIEDKTGITVLPYGSINVAKPGCNP